MSDIIQVTYGELTTSFENEVMKAVQQVGIHVNKEELLKALELADKLVHCEDCRWQDDCSQVVENIEGTVSTQLRWCSDGERIEE